VCLCVCMSAGDGSVVASHGSSASSSSSPSSSLLTVRVRDMSPMSVSCVVNRQHKQLTHSMSLKATAIVYAIQPSGAMNSLC